MPVVYYEPANGADGNQVPCQSPNHDTAGKGWGLIVVDGVPWCILEANLVFGIEAWSTSWTPSGDSRAGIAQIGAALPDDIATWAGPVAAEDLRLNDFSNNTVYDVLISVQTPTDQRIWLGFRASPNELRNAQSRSLLLAQLGEGATVLTREAISNSVVYWREV